MIKVCLTFFFVWSFEFQVGAVTYWENGPIRHVTAQPQRIIITGTVTDENAIPMPGVNVLEKGTTNGAVTNL